MPDCRFTGPSLYVLHLPGTRPNVFQSKRCACSGIVEAHASNHRLSGLERPRSFVSCSSFFPVLSFVVELCSLIDDFLRSPVHNSEATGFSFEDTKQLQSRMDATCSAGKRLLTTAFPSRHYRKPSARVFTSSMKSRVECAASAIVITRGRLVLANAPVVFIDSHTDMLLRSDRSGRHSVLIKDVVIVHMDAHRILFH